MKLQSLFSLYLLGTVVFFAIDIVWLAFVARKFYFTQLDHLMANPINWPAAAVFYLIYIGGILYFAVLPATQTGDVRTALLNGALFGFFAYATYELTNLATLRDWPIAVVVVDLIWGTVLTGSVAAVTFFLSQKIGLV